MECSIFFGVQGYSGEHRRISDRDFRQRMRLTSAEPQLFRVFWAILLMRAVYPHIDVRNMRGMLQNP